MNQTQLQSRLAQDRNLIDRALRRVLQPSSAVPSRLSEAMRYAVLGPGKRLRPALCLETFRAAGGAPDRTVLPFCCGLELIHAFSLVHDDLPSMDDDDFRRGQPSLHRRFDEATAILAADALFALAFELFTRTRIQAELIVKAANLVCRAVGPAGMTGGQMMDIEGLRRTPMALIHRKKTAEFIAASLESGALLAGAGRATCTALHRAGLELGELFQLTDDLLDSGEEKELSTRLKRRADAKAARAERAFAKLGAQYALFAALPRLILRRSS